MTAKIFRPNEPRSYPELPSAFVFSPAWLSLQSSAPPGSAPGLETPSLQAFPSILVLVTCAASALPWSSCSLPGPWGPQKTEGRWGFQGRAELQWLWPLPSWATPGAILHLPPGPCPAGSQKTEAEESRNPGWEAATRHRSKAGLSQASQGLIAFLWSALPHAPLRPQGDNQVIGEDAGRVPSMCFNVGSHHLRLAFRAGG